MNREQIEALLDDADTALRAGKHAEAEKLYDEAHILATSMPKTNKLSNRALDGIDRARKLAQNGSGLIDLVQPDWAALEQVSPLIKAIKLQQLLNNGISHNPAKADLRILLEQTLDRLRQQALESAADLVAEAERIADQAYSQLQPDEYQPAISGLEQALKLLEAPPTPADLADDSATQQAYAQLVDAFANSELQANHQAYHERLINIKQAQALVAKAKADYDRARGLFERSEYQSAIDLLQSTQVTTKSWPVLQNLLERTLKAQAKTVVTPAINPNQTIAAHQPTPAQAESDDQHTLLEDQRQARIDELVSEANRALNTRSRDNYKQAENMYTQILGFSTLTMAQRQLYETSLADIKREHAAFLVEYGELITARQLEDLTSQAIAIRKMLNAGKLFDDQGNDLYLEFTKLMNTLRQRAQTLADEQVHNAKKAQAEGLRFLEEKLLATAIDHYSKALEAINGTIFTQAKLLEMPNQSSAVSPSNSGAPPSPQAIQADATATQMAIQALQNSFMDESLKQSQTTCQQAIADAETLRQHIQYIRPRYAEAEKAFNQGAYNQALSSLDQALSLVSEAEDWQQVKYLRQAIQQRWERQALRAAENLLLEANVALAQLDLPALQNVLSRLTELEPDLHSAQLEAKRREGHGLLTQLLAQKQKIADQASQAEQLLADQVRQAEQLLADQKFDQANQVIRDLMAHALGKAEGQRLLDRLLHKQVMREVRETETFIYGTDIKALHTIRDRLNHYLNDIGEVSNRREQDLLREQITTAVAQAKHRIEQLEQLQHKDRQANQLLEQALAAYELRNYEAALNTIDQVLALIPTHPKATILRAQYRDEWLSTLRRKVTQFMIVPMENLDLLVQTIATIKANLDYHDLELEVWEKTTQRLQAKRDGLALFHKAEYSAAIEVLSRADGQDPTIVEALKEARFKLGEVAVNQQRWSEAVELLRLADPGLPKVKALLNRATSEFEFSQAIELRQNQEFEQAIAHLQAAKRYELGVASELIDQEQIRILAAQHAARRLEQIRYQADAVLANRQELLSLIHELTQERDRLSSDPKLSSESVYQAIQQQINLWQDRYKTLISGERTLYIQAAKSQIDSNPVAALESLRLALNLAATRQDSEVEELIKQAQAKLIGARDRLAASIMSFLQSSQTTLARCEQLLEQAIHELAQDESPHQRLSDARFQLEKAQPILHQVEVYLEQARLSWLNTRQKGDADFGHATNLLQQAEKLLSDKSYNHADLDSGSNHNIHSLLRDDRAVLQLVSQSATKLMSLLKGSLADANLQEAQQLFETLKHAEETSSKNLSELSIKLHRQFMPPTMVERYPKQYQALNLLADRINESRRLLTQLEEIELWRIERSRIDLLCGLFEQWNRHDRFGLQASVRAV